MGELTTGEWGTVSSSSSTTEITSPDEEESSLSREIKRLRELAISLKCKVDNLSNTVDNKILDEMKKELDDNSDILSSIENLANIPDPPVINNIKEIDNYVEITFTNQNVFANPVEKYEIWSSYNNQNFKMIDTIEGSTEETAEFTYEDYSYEKTGGVYYKIFAVNKGVRSNPITTNILVSNEVVDPEIKKFIRILK
jgi:hypothetical protein